MPESQKAPKIVKTAESPEMRLDGELTPQQIVTELDRFIVGQDLPSALLRSHCATAGGGSTCRGNCAMKSCPTTSS